MAYKQEKNGDIVINGWENGIADDPYSGISDIRNINLVSIPKEASVNFSTVTNVATNKTGTMTTSSAGSDTVTLSTNSLETFQAIQFSVLSDATKGIVLNTPYWVVALGAGVYELHTNNACKVADLVNITADSLTGTWATINMSTPKHFTYLKTAYIGKYFMVDSAGLVWSNMFATNPSGYWTYTGNTTLTGGHGNGLVNYVPSDSLSSGIGYVFVFRDYCIDYATITSNTTIAWTYGWNPATGTTAQTNYLKSYGSSGGISNSSHECFLAPDNVVYYCDGAYIGRFYEETGQVFVPTTTTTYIADNTRLLPCTDTSQCLGFLGTNLMIGGRQNVVYPWDTTSPTFSYPILLPEYNVQKMVTVNTTMYMFIGNRGRIYYTNGTNAQLYKKIPDHLSGTVEPYFTWGGACSTKNQLYFSAQAYTNAGSLLSTYGGVWAIDLDSKALRLTNKLSYGTYAGYASAIIPNFATNPAGTGLYIGWDSGASTYGIDTTSSIPYYSGEAYIDSDLIPIGTFLKPTTNGRVEFKLSMPLLANETVSLWYRQKFSDAFTQIGTTTTNTTNGAGTTFSNVYQNVPFQKSQWIQIRAVLTSTSTASYCRLTEIRLGN